MDAVSTNQISDILLFNDKHLNDIYTIYTYTIYTIRHF